MARTQEISHYLERSFDAASLVAALAFARSDVPSSLADYTERQTDQLVDLLHDLAFNGRKLIELVSREKWSSADGAKQPSLSCHREGPSGDMSEVTLSLWDIFGRLIHSDRVEIDRSRIPTPEGVESSGEAAWAFNVASDKDSAGTSIFVFFDFFLVDFSRLVSAVRRELYRPIRVEK